MENCYVTKLNFKFDDPEEKLNYLGLIMEVVPSVSTGASGTRPLVFRVSDDAGIANNVVAYGNFIDHNAVFGTSAESGEYEQDITNAIFRCTKTGDENIVKLLITDIDEGVEEIMNFYSYDVNNIFQYVPGIKRLHGILNHSTYSSKVAFKSTLEICSQLTHLEFQFNHSEKYGDFDVKLEHFANNTNLVNLTLSSGNNVNYNGGVTGNLSSLVGCVGLTTLNLEKMVAVAGDMNAFLDAMAQNRNSGTLALNFKSDTNVTYSAPITSRECTIQFTANGWEVV